MRTEVAFHFGAPDRLAYTCRLLRKANAAGARMLVRADSHLIGDLDSALWNLSPADFVTHCDDTAAQEVQSRSAVVLTSGSIRFDASRSVLINLADDVPEGFEQFQRVIEVVSNDEYERNMARRRWKHYTGCGYTITRHDLKSRAGD